MGQSGESLEFCSVSVLWGFSQRMPGPLKLSHIGDRKDLEAQKHGLTTKATVTFKCAVGPNKQLKGHNET